jgi:DNA-binding NarL/FixJ family response regulator
MISVPLGDHDWLHDDSAASAEARALLNVVADQLPTVQGVVLRRHIGDGETLTAIATELGMSRRTITRHWRALRVQLGTEILGDPLRRHMA